MHAAAISLAPVVEWSVHGGVLSLEIIHVSLVSCCPTSLTCMQMGQNVMQDPHLVHMHWCPQSRHTVFDALMLESASGRSGSGRREGASINLRGGSWCVQSLA